MLLIKRILMQPLLFFIGLVFTASCFATNAGFLSTLEEISDNSLHSPKKAQAQLLALEQQEPLSSLPLEQRIRFRALSAQIAAKLNNSQTVIQQTRLLVALTNHQQKYQGVEQKNQLLLLKHLNISRQENLALALVNKLLATLEVGDSSSHHAKLMLISANIHDKLNHKDIALVNLKSAHHIALKSGDEPLLHQIALELAAKLLLLRDLEGASSLLEQTKHYYLNDQSSVENLVVQVKLSELAYSRGDSQRALTVLLKARRLATLSRSGLFQFVIELRIAELYLESKQLSDVSESLNALASLSTHLRRNDDRERLLLVRARYRVAVDDYAGLEQLLSADGVLSLGNSSKSEARMLALLKLKAQALAARGEFEQAYIMLSQNQKNFVNHQQRRNADNLQRQRLMFDVELLEQKNRDLTRDNDQHQSAINTHGRVLSKLNIALFVVGVIATLAIFLASVFYYRRLQLYKMSHRDALTGLYNRHYLDLIFRRLTRKYTKYNQPMTAIMLDLDHFKNVNDTYGHTFGDQVLVSFAHCCEQILPPSSIIVRLGGEEFLALLPQWDSLEGAKIAETLRIAIANNQIMTDSGESVHVTVSIGVASFSRRIKDQKSLLQLADQRLYIAKSQGRNQVVAPETVKDRFISALGER